MIGLGRPYVRLMQNPTGTIGSVARAMLNFLYYGIDLGLPPHADPRVIGPILASRDTTYAIPAERATTFSDLVGTRHRTIDVGASNE